MAINCYLTLNGTLFYPELPVGIRLIPFRDQRRQVNATLRTAHRAVKREYTFTLRDATEAQWTDWLTAADFTTSIIYTDERGDNRTVTVQSVEAPLTRTTPNVEGSLATNGAGFYDLTVVVEEV